VTRQPPEPELTRRQYHHQQSCHDCPGPGLQCAQHVYVALIHGDNGSIDLVETRAIVEPAAGLFEHAINADVGKCGYQHGECVGIGQVTAVTGLDAEPEMQPDKHVYPDNRDQYYQFDQEYRFQRN